MPHGTADSRHERGRPAEGDALVTCPCHEGCPNLVFDDPCIPCVIRRETGLLPCDPDGRAPTLTDRELFGV